MLNLRLLCFPPIQTRMHLSIMLYMYWTPPAPTCRREACNMLEQVFWLSNKYRTVMGSQTLQGACPKKWKRLPSTGVDLSKIMGEPNFWENISVAITDKIKGFSQIIEGSRAWTAPQSLRLCYQGFSKAWTPSLICASKLIIYHRWISYNWLSDECA